MENDFINLETVSSGLSGFKNNKPFDHAVVDGFFKDEIARALEADFPDFDDSAWYVYKNSIEDKKALNDWNRFPHLTYKVFSFLNSKEFVDYLSKAVGIELYPDVGLHGGGWHIHGTGGNLNPHLDYSIHPKMGLQRRINIIMYLSRDLKPGMGGELGLWSHNQQLNSPKDLVVEVLPVFNRAVIFDTSQNSWHGMSRVLTCPENVYRKSLAVYYLCKPEAQCQEHQRAYFAPRDHQKDDGEVLDLILRRADLHNSKEVYKTEK